MSIIREVDRIEIITLQDNYIDVTAADNTETITRTRKLMGGAIGQSILAEHGFSAFLTVWRGSEKRTMLFDFGVSTFGAAHNADILGVSLDAVEVMALSHGHYDHFGGFEQLVARTNRKGIEFVVHPSAFRTPRYIKYHSGATSIMPPFHRDTVEAAGLCLVETCAPYPLLDDTVLFLGEIERKTVFEKGLPTAFFEEDGIEIWDPLEDDTSIVILLKNKGLVVLSGCAHSGIINTVRHAQTVTGIENIHAVMGGFHLSGPLFEPIIEETVEALKEVDPFYVIPCHCTGRKAINHIERELPESFLMNMSGTRVTFFT